MNILGIDFSLNGTGLSVYNGKKVTFKKVFTSIKKNYEGNKEDFILLPKFETTGQKLDWVVDKIVNCTKYDMVCMEDHIGSYYDWMDGYGIIKHYLRLNKVPYIMISPTSLKKFAGTGRATKEDMINLLIDQYGFDFSYIGPLSNNIVDATWLAIVGYLYHKKYVLNKPINEIKDREKILSKLIIE